MRLSQQSVMLLQRKLRLPLTGIADEALLKLVRPSNLTGAVDALEQMGVRFQSRPMASSYEGDPCWATMITSRHPKLELHARHIAPVSGAFTPCGVMIHHTAGPQGRKRLDVDKLIKGRPDLSGPLANAGINRDGFVDWITNGRSHHAGSGSAEVLEAVMQDKRLSPPEADSAYGNSYFYGIEIDNSGKPEDAYPTQQLRAAAQVAETFCHFWSWDPNTRVIGHKEWTRRKVDPSLNMDMFRLMVRKSSPAITTPLEDRVEALENRITALEAFIHRVAGAT